MLKRIVKAVFRKFGLQISKLPRQSESRGDLRPLCFGSYIIHTDNEALINSYSVYPETNRVITRLVAALVSRNTVVSMIDIGANCGDSAVLAKCGGDIPVLCIEGDSRLAELLHSNLADFKGITTRQVFLGENQTEVMVNVEKAGWNNTLVTNDPNATQNIVLETLDSVAGNWSGLSQLKFVKCDTEGYDVRILFGGKSTLASQQPVILFEYNREAMAQTGEEGFRVFQFLRELNYDRLLIYDAFGRFICATTLEYLDLLRDLHEYADGKSGKVYYYDILAFSKKDEELAKSFSDAERCHRARL
jgi:FkbM family methyltransferase